MQVQDCILEVGNTVTILEQGNSVSTPAIATFVLFVKYQTRSLERKNIYNNRLRI